MTWDPTTASALAGLLTGPLATNTRRCGLHGDDTTSGRCGSCDQLAYDQAEAHLEAHREAREVADDAAGMDAEERWYALHDGWVQ